MNVTTDKAQSLINGLIIINNDRYDGYQTAADETKDPELKSLFNKYSTQSKQFAADLKRFVSTEDRPDEGETTNSGKLYRAWMDLKAAVTANDRKAILASCEFGEDVALKTYKEVSEEAHELPEEVRMLVNSQKSELQQAHDHVKSLRDHTK